MPQITAVTVEDVRFPTSLTADGSDAMNKDGDYSAAYVVLHTDGVDGAGAPLAGHGLTFTIGRGNDIVAAAARPPGAASRGPGRGDDGRGHGRGLPPAHLRLAAAVARPGEGRRPPVAGRRDERGRGTWSPGSPDKPLWRLLVDMSPEQLVDIAGPALPVRRADPGRGAGHPARQGAHQGRPRSPSSTATGYPAYTTSAGWLGYGDDKLRRLCQEAVDAGYGYVKLKVGANLDDDIRRCAIAREILGPDRNLMIDANQVWDVGQAIEWVKALAQFTATVDRGADQPRRHPGPRRRPPRRRSDRRRHRRALPQPGDVQAAVPGRGHRLLPAGHRPAGQHQRDRRRAAARREVRRPGVPARRRRRAVRDGPARVGVRLRRDLGGSHDRVTEFVDHLHEHFTDPCIIRDTGSGSGYVLPSQPGYSTRMRPESVALYRFPDGHYWAATDPTTVSSPEAAYVIAGGKATPAGR